FSGELNRADVSLTGFAEIDVTSGGAGDISIFANNINVLGGSDICAGIGADGACGQRNTDFGSVNAVAGDINFNAIATVTIEGGVSDVNNNLNNNSMGNAGNINIETGSLFVQNGGRINARTFGQGNAGSINIAASNTVVFEDRENSTFIRSNVETEADGNSGGVNILTSSLAVNNGAQIQSLVRGNGNSGKVRINAEDSVAFDGRDIDDFPSGAFSLVVQGGNGNAGGIEIATNLLSMTNRAQLLSNTDGIGNAGDINIQAKNEVNLVNSSILSEVTASTETSGGGRGEGGDINIITGSLILQDGSALLADTENIGNAGNIIIEASERVILEGQGLNASPNAIDIIPSQITATVDDFEGAVGNGGNISISTPYLSITDDGFIRVNTFGQGDAGNLIINTGKLLAENGGQISATTFSEGNAGNLTVTASESIELVGSDGEFPSGLFASAIEGNGNAGNLTIATDQLIVRDEAVVSVGNFQQVVEGGPEPRLPGSGDAGTLNIKANSIDVNNGTITAANANGIGGELVLSTNSLNLENGAFISAETTSNIGTGGNINLNVDGTLQMRDNSLISAQATEGATGGNIDINTEFIVAFPNQNNDIIANASQGNGGNINITAEALFGIEERPLNDITNDINASSEFGLDGSVSIVTPDINPIQTDIQLPNNPLESGQTVAQACRSTGTADKPSGLIVKGKGGIPRQPIEPFDSETILVDESTTNSNLQANYPEIKPIETSIGNIYPARGIIKTEDGKIILTAYATDNLNSRTPHNSANCTPS
ncbi:MAG: beta strand repeat-containing protein, partial [Xenococcus sp. (in: cyanobacteria)]